MTSDIKSLLSGHLILYELRKEKQELLAWNIASYYINVCLLSPRKTKSKKVLLLILGLDSTSQNLWKQTVHIMEMVFLQIPDRRVIVIDKSQS